MVRMFVRHAVKDYRAWRREYDGFAKVQKRMGVRRQAVYRTAGRPNDVTVTHDFRDLRAAKAFIRSRELRAAMRRAGIRGRPLIWFAKET